MTFNPKTGVFTPSTILLRGDDIVRYEEKLGSGAITPGMLLRVTSADAAIAHDVRGGRWDRMVAIENSLAGKDLVNTAGNTIDDDYPDGARVRVVYTSPNHSINALLHAGESVTYNDYAISYGDGTVAKAATTILANNLASSTTITNTVTETTFSNGTVTIPKNTLKAGDQIRFRGEGSFPSTNSTDTANIKLKIGSTVIAQTGAVDVANNDVFYFEGILLVQSVGATGSIVASGVVTIGAAGTSTVKSFALAATTLDTTANATITVTATWSVASASNQVKLDILTVETIKAGNSVAAGTAVIGRFDKTVDNSLGVASVRVPVIVL